MSSHSTTAASGSQLVSVLPSGHITPYTPETQQAIAALVTTQVEVIQYRSSVESPIPTPRVTTAPLPSSAAPTDAALSAGINQFFGLPSTPMPAFVRETSQSALPTYHARSGSESTLLPAYEEVESKNELEGWYIAKYLFLYGFLFPPFWIIGACILFSPPQSAFASSASISPQPSTKDIEAGGVRTQDEESELIWQMERLWAWRCIFASATLIAVVAGIVVVWWAARGSA